MAQQITVQKGNLVVQLAPQNVAAIKTAALMANAIKANARMKPVVLKVPKAVNKV